jgi:hypothetical protein
VVALAGTGKRGLGAREKKTPSKRKGTDTGGEQACKFGDACGRPGCWFWHPRDGQGGAKKSKKTTW